MTGDRDGPDPIRSVVMVVDGCMRTIVTEAVSRAHVAAAPNHPGRVPTPE